MTNYFYSYVIYKIIIITYKTKFSSDLVQDLALILVFIAKDPKNYSVPGANFSPFRFKYR